MLLTRIWDLALWVCCLGALQIVGAATCNKDNCYRALFPTQSPSVYSAQSSFCATYTTTINTATTGFPSKATSGCGTDRDKYSSACSCNPGLPTSTTTATASCAPTPAINIVKNGGFECGLAPWVAVNGTDTEDRIYHTGDNSNSAYVFFQEGPPDNSGNTPPSSISQNITVTVGQYYILTYRVQFENCGGIDRAIRTYLNKELVENVEPCGVNPPNYSYQPYTDHAVAFTATKNPTGLRFEYYNSDNSGQAMIDNVVIGPANP